MLCNKGTSIDISIPVASKFVVSLFLGYGSPFCESISTGVFQVLTVSLHHALVLGTESKHVGLNLGKSSHLSEVFSAIKEK